MCVERRKTGKILLAINNNHAQETDETMMLIKIGPVDVRSAEAERAICFVVVGTE